MILHCPSCHCRFPLEAGSEDLAARELLAFLTALDGRLARPLVSYLGLFRSASRALSWDRAFRLCREVLVLHEQPEIVAAALAETVEAIRAKAGDSGVRPLANHNYLKRVIESVAARPGLRPMGGPRLPDGYELIRTDGKAPVISKTAGAVDKLEGMKRG